MSTPNLKVKDAGLAQIFAKLKKAPAVSVAVGIQGEKAEAGKDKYVKKEGKRVKVTSSTVTNVLVAAVHEFGSPTRKIPERPFLRSTLADNAAKYQKTLDRIATGAIDPKSNERRELRMLGEQYRKDIIAKIKGKQFKGLSDARKAQRGGSDTPLWDTGQLVNSIAVVLVDPAKARATT